MRSMLVIGVGRFGSNLAVKLTELGNEVMVIDQDEDAVQKIAPLVTAAQIGDCMDIEVLRSIGARSFDVCFVCISENFQSSLEITSLLKDLGAPMVVAKADREIHAKFLLRIGADEVIYPERDMARRTAARFSTKGAFDYIELSDEYAIFEFALPEHWIGKNLRELNIRGRYHVNIIGLKKDGRVTPLTDPEYAFQKEEHILAAGTNENLSRILKES